jgi:large subunit ribosomal protein L19
MDIASLVEIKQNPKIPDIVPGDMVKVSTRIVEGGKERIQVFQGLIIKVRRGGAGASFTVRHVAFGIGVERTFLLHSPLVEKVEVVRHGKVRRAKLYYLRGLSGKAARRKIKRVERKVKKLGEEVLALAPEEIMEPALELGEGTAAGPEAEMAPGAGTEAAASEPVAEAVPEPEAVPEAEKAQEGIQVEAPALEKEEGAESVGEPSEEPGQEKEIPQS